MSPMWLKASGKSPRSSPLTGSTSSASRPTSLTKAAARSNTVQARAGCPARARAWGQPEGAQKERAFLAGERVVGPVAEHQSAIISKAFFGRVDRGQHSGIVGGKEPDQGEHQAGGVKLSQSDNPASCLRRSISAVRKPAPSVNVAFRSASPMIACARIGLSMAARTSAGAKEVSACRPDAPLLHSLGDGATDARRARAPPRRLLDALIRPHARCA
jgi:hypothetical protein